MVISSNRISLSIVSFSYDIAYDIFEIVVLIFIRYLINTLDIGKNRRSLIVYRESSAKLRTKIRICSINALTATLVFTEISVRPRVPQYQAFSTRYCHRYFSNASK